MLNYFKGIVAYSMLAGLGLSNAHAMDASDSLGLRYHHGATGVQNAVADGDIDFVNYIQKEGTTEVFCRVEANWQKVIDKMQNSYKTQSDNGKVPNQLQRDSKAVQVAIKRGNIAFIQAFSKEKGHEDSKQYGLVGSWGEAVIATEDVLIKEAIRYGEVETIRDFGKNPGHNDPKKYGIFCSWDDFTKCIEDYKRNKKVLK